MVILRNNEYAVWHRPKSIEWSLGFEAKLKELNQMEKLLNFEKYCLFLAFEGGGRSRRKFWVGFGKRQGK